jgi:hypothetical protein
MMQVSWIFADGHQLDPVVPIDAIKNIGPTWGGWRTWRTCGTDNVICNSLPKAKELLARNFQNSCNFYIPKHYFNDLGRPTKVNLYEGNFQESIDHSEDIVAAHLAVTGSDIILLVGFDLSIDQTISDQFKQHQVTTYHGLLRSIIANDPNVQWVCVDPPHPIDKAYQNLTNLTCDKMNNVLQLLL